MTSRDGSRRVHTPGRPRRRRIAPVGVQARLLIIVTVVGCASLGFEVSGASETRIAFLLLLTTVALVATWLAIQRLLIRPLKDMTDRCRALSVGERKDQSDRLPTEFHELEIELSNIEAILCDREVSLVDSAARARRQIEQQRFVWHTLEQAMTEQRLLAAPALHDDTIQVVTAIGYRLSALSRSSLPSPIALQLEDMATESRKAVERLRLLLFELTPAELAVEGLAVSIAQLVSVANAVHSETEFSCDLSMRDEPAAPIARQLFMAARELVANIRQHAKATTATVWLRQCGQGWQLRVSDNGIGFSGDPSLQLAPGHLGLAWIRFEVESRGGWLRTRSASGHGSEVEIWLPGDVTEADPLASQS